LLAKIKNKAHATHCLVEYDFKTVVKVIIVKIKSISARLISEIQTNISNFTLNLWNTFDQTYEILQISNE